MDDVNDDAILRHLKIVVFETKLLFSVLMPPPPEPKPVIKELPAKVISKSKIFKCMECHRGFKREIKLIKHVTRKHGVKKIAQKLNSPNTTEVEKEEKCKNSNPIGKSNF